MNAPPNARQRRPLETWWGILAAIAGVVGAIAAIAGILVSGNINPAPDSPPSSTPSSASQPTPSVQTTKASYIAAADILCRNAYQKHQDIQNEIDANEAEQAKLAVQTDPSAIQEHAQYLRQEAGLLRDSVSLFRGLVADLANINPPRGDEGKIRQLLEPLSRSNDLVYQAANQMATLDVQSANQLLLQANSLGDQHDSLAREYGFKICGYS